LCSAPLHAQTALCFAFSRLREVSSQCAQQFSFCRCC
jgi:hypothetical protein